jgi:hypothetical protein
MQQMEYRATCNSEKYFQASIFNEMMITTMEIALRCWLIWFHLDYEISRSHMKCNFDIQCNNFSKTEDTIKTCSEEYNKLHSRRKCMCTKDVV